MNRRRALPNTQDLVWLSGWVFADLLLGLAIIFLAGTRGSSLLEIAALAAYISAPLALLPQWGAQEIAASRALYASAPLIEMLVTVTVFPVPTFLSANAADV